MALGRRARRWLVVLAVTAAVLAIGGWWIDRQLEPRRLTAFVLAQAGKSLNLELRFSGEPEYAFKPEPRLLVPNLQVRDPADGSLFLSARRAEVSLPWSTITGGEPVITRIALEAPNLDLAGLLRWQAAQPKKPFKLPTLTRGLHVDDGLVAGDGFSISALGLDLPRLQAGEPAQLTASGRYRQGSTELEFQSLATLATPGLESDLVIGASGRLLRQPAPLPYRLDARGHYRFDDVGVAITAPELSFEGASPLPTLRGKAEFASTDQLSFSFDGRLAQWPKDWPSLPSPLADSAKDLALRLAYAGAPGLTDPVTLHLDKDATAVDADVRIAQLQAWLDAPPGSPLPPLNATAKTPRLDIDGIQLEGVEVRIGDSEPVATPP